MKKTVSDWKALMQELLDGIEKNWVLLFRLSNYFESAGTNIGSRRSASSLSETWRHSSKASHSCGLRHGDISVRRQSQRWKQQMFRCERLRISSRSGNRSDRGSDRTRNAAWTWQSTVAALERWLVGEGEAFASDRISLRRVR